MCRKFPDENVSKDEQIFEPLFHMFANISHMNAFECLKKDVLFYFNIPMFNRAIARYSLSMECDER